MFPRQFRILLPLLALVFASNGALADNAPPEFLASGLNPSVRTGSAAQELPLSSLFRDPDVPGSAVQVNVRLGAAIKPVYLALFDAQTPVTVANFLHYVNSGRYGANFFHRLATGFVLQGGGFAWNSSSQEVLVQSFGAIANEPGISNLRGTIAMAKLDGDPNSATSQWFVNLADNSGNLNVQNGGFTVFGRVLGSSMAVIDEVAALPTVNLGQPFDSLPVQNYTSGSGVVRANTVETTAAVVPALTYSINSSSPELVTAVLTGTSLVLTPSATRSGTATVTLTATDLEGGVTQGLLAVKIPARSEGWSEELGADGQPTAFALGSATGSPIAADTAPVNSGRVGLGRSQSRTITLRNDGSSALSGLTVTAAGQVADFTVSGPGTTTLAPGASTSLTLTFAPTATGVRAASLRIGTADANDASFTLALTGTGFDIVAPVIAGVSDQTLTAGAAGTIVVPDWRGATVTATDETGVTSFTQTPAPGTVLPIGSYPLSFTATETTGKSTTVQAVLLVAFTRVSNPAVVAAGASAGAPVPAAGSDGLAAGSTLSAFGTPAISDLRHLAAKVTIASGNSRLAAIYRENGASAGELVARQYGASGVIGTSFKAFQDPLLSPGGKIAFFATLTGRPASSDGGVWTDLSGSLAPVLQEGSEIGSSGLKIKGVMSLSLADDALLALVKLLPQRGVVVAGVSDTALLRLPVNGTIVLLARTGTSFEGSVIRHFSVLQPAARSAGQGRWTKGAVTLARFTLADRRTVLVQLDAAGGQTRLLQAGANDAFFPQRLAALGFPALGGPSVALLATKAVQSGVNGADNDALLLAADGVHFTAAVTENMIAGTSGGGRFAALSDPVVNAAGNMLFFSTLRGGSGSGANAAGLWQATAAAAPEAVARIGFPATDAAGAEMSGIAWAAITSFALPDGEGAGALFVGQLAGAARPAEKTGLWAVDSSGLVRLVLRTGWMVPQAGSEKKVTAFTVLNALPGSFGARRSYNASGSVAVQATFSDHSQGLLRVDIP